MAISLSRERKGGARGGKEGEPEGKRCSLTLSTVAAGKADVERTRESELTDVSPELVGSTALNDC